MRGKKTPNNRFRGLSLLEAESYRPHDGTFDSIYRGYTNRLLSGSNLYLWTVVSPCSFDVGTPLAVIDVTTPV